MITPKTQLLQAVKVLKKKVGAMIHAGDDVLLLSKPLIPEKRDASSASAPATPVVNRPRPKPFHAVQKESRPEPKNEFERFMHSVMDCESCAIAKSRKQVVFGEGNPKATLVFVGEAPGADEEREGKPFAGEPGNLLTKIIASIGLKREDVYICNVLKCRPPGNRNPSEEELNNCRDHLEKQLSLLQPKVICALGTFAAQTLLEKKEPIGKLRGQSYSVKGVHIVPTIHPAALLYHPSNKKLVWQDMKLIAKLLGLPATGTKR